MVAESIARRSARLAIALWIVGLLFAISALLLSVSARLPAPYRDDWAWLLWLLGDRSLASYFVPHNEHVIPLARVLMQLQYALEGSNGYTMLAVSLASLGTVAWLALREIGRRWPGDVETRHAVSGVTLAVLCFAWQLQSMVFPAAVLFPLVEMFAAAAVVALLDAAEATGRARWRRLALAGLCASGAMLTTTNGLPVPVMLALVAAGRRMGWRVVAAWGAMAAAGVWLYVILVLLPSGSAATTLSAAPSASLAAGFFLAFFASFIAQAHAGAAVVVGALLFAAGAYAVGTTVRRGQRPRIELFAAGLLLFAMASAALAAPSRANFGIVQVAQSRYASFVQPYWAALVMVAASRLTLQRRRPMMLPALVVSVGGLFVHAAIGAVWVAKADNVGTARLAMRAGGGDHEWMETLYPEPAFIREVMAGLIARGDTTLAPALPELAPDRVAGAATCDAAVRASRAPAGFGLRVQGAVATEAEQALFLDQVGRTVGLGRPAPIANQPNPSPMEVARAVAAAWTAPATTRPEWIGFAAEGAGGPYTMVLLGRDGAIQCTARVPGP